MAPSPILYLSFFRLNIFIDTFTLHICPYRNQLFRHAYAGTRFYGNKCVMALPLAIYPIARESCLNNERMTPLILHWVPTYVHCTHDIFRHRLMRYNSRRSQASRLPVSRAEQPGTPTVRRPPSAARPVPAPRRHRAEPGGPVCVRAPRLFF